MTIIIGYRDNNNALIFGDSMVTTGDVETGRVVKTIKLDNFSVGSAGHAVAYKLINAIVKDKPDMSFKDFYAELQEGCVAVNIKMKEVYKVALSFTILVVSKESMLEIDYTNGNMNVKEIKSTVHAIGSGKKIGIAVAEALLINTDLNSVWSIGEALKTAIVKASEYGEGCGGNVNLVVVKGKTENGTVYNLQDSLSQ